MAVGAPMTKKKRDKRDGEIWSPGYWENLPFTGEIPFELTLRLWGKTVKRKARVVFAHAPDGQYYCTGSETLKESIISNSLAH